MKALNETARHSFEGGDAFWEKQKLGTYENSEVRFIEIQEKLCSDVTSGKSLCYKLAELHENELESWFFEERSKDVKLYTFLCITQSKLCCPYNTYGPNCIPCPCGSHGECMNDGIKDKNIVCRCHLGYTGKLCDKCKYGYYQDGDNSSFSCKMCDKACKDSCKGPGPKNCEACSDGYYFHSELGGCVRLNSFDIIQNLSESEEGKKPKTEQLVNTRSFLTKTEHLEL
ncbi:cysteine-rich with EGF-like domain protein 2 [Trichonephila clavata]|uniref:Cysteine-rich with EGF-like domain protein 2 n=1 Tax=Trichonephila clavata TaxID=2740835 RepID=A0A8X6FSF0_TRICU|nr:cysteine-rich with EGF-like domain protein 2 [Trichonephila clavata]